MNKHVLKMQKMLKESGFYYGSLDGIAGPKTTEALQKSLAELNKSVATPVPATSRNLYKLSSASLRKLEGAHPDLQKVVKRAIQLTEVDFKVGEVLRTYKRQKDLYRQGATKTMNSRHLTGHAVDLYALTPDGKVSWDWDLYYKIEKAMKQAARELRVPITWGGDWSKFKDGPHYQLTWSDYPK